MAYSRTAVVFALLLHAACLSSPLGLVAAHIWPLSGASTRRELPVKAPAMCPPGVVCPEGASCAVDSNSHPFCKCPAGQAIINGECAPAKNWTTVGTSVAVYKRTTCKASAGDVEAPVVQRAPPPNTSTCVSLAPFNGTLGCVKILWNVNDGAPNHLVCGKLVFWEQPDCSGLNTTVEITLGGWKKVNPQQFNIVSTFAAMKGINYNTRSFSCLTATLPPGVDLCALASCPPNSTCSLKNGFAKCICDPGLVMPKDGSAAACVEPCSIKDCGEGGTCFKLSNYEPYCDCKQGYEQEGVSGSCIGQGQCKNCLQSTWGKNSLPYTYCPPGFSMRSGTCVPGLVPDVADVAISIFSEVNFGTTNPPYVFRLKPFTCVTIPEVVVASAKSAGFLYRAPESYISCTAVVFYTQPNCGGTPLTADVPTGDGVLEIPLTSLYGLAQSFKCLLW
ncbi:unnamed protein product [Closterium sp. Yama58-4]|nr:unnamed protein product [Closterium sp. Yama58-4]